MAAIAVASDSASDERDLERRGQALLAAAVAGVATALFLLPWWNRFLGVTLDGYFPYYGHRIAAGETPYRDFFLHLPPLQALAHAGLEELFGRRLILSRLAGALARVVIAGTLAAWLARRFRVGTAIVAALAAVWLASGDDTEILDLYNHHALLASIVAGFAASRALSRSRGSLRWWLLCGASASLAFWTKQTIGLGVSVAIPMALLLVSWRSVERRATLGPGLGGFVAGWSVPALILGGWLATRGALGAFLREVFVDAAASKGPIWMLLPRPWIDPFRIDVLALPASIGALGALAVAVLGWRSPNPSRPAPRPRLGVSIAALAAVVALVLGHGIAGGALVEPELLRTAQRVGVFLAIFGILAPTLALSAAALRRRLEAVEQQTLLLALVGAGTGAALALSWPGGEAVALPSLAVVLALALDAGPLPGWQRPLRMAVTSLAAIAVAAAVALKLLVPFDFVLWREPPIARAESVSSLPALAGLRLGRGTQQAVDGVVGALEAWTRPGEPILAFPALPLIYWLADRPAATFAAVHWIDVTPDSVVAADLARVIASPPVAVVRMHITERSLEVNQRYFRPTGELALRDFQDRLIGLLGERYELVYSSRGVPGVRQPLEVWVRRDRFAARGGERDAG